MHPGPANRSLEREKERKEREREKERKSWNRMNMITRTIARLRDTRVVYVASYSFLLEATRVSSKLLSGY